MEESMTGPEFMAACRILWGQPDGRDWGVAGASEFLRVGERSLYAWAAGSKDVPEGVAGEVVGELARQLVIGSNPATRVIRMALGTVPA
jgi:hypothetical protein